MLMAYYNPINRFAVRITLYDESGPECCASCYRVEHFEIVDSKDHVTVEYCNFKTVFDIVTVPPLYGYHEIARVCDVPA